MLYPGDDFIASKTPFSYEHPFIHFLTTLLHTTMLLRRPASTPAPSTAVSLTAATVQRMQTSPSRNLELSTQESD